MLDEPSIGLHPRDNQRLIDILRQLRDQGNTVLVVEHDADMIRVADHIVDLGLGAGEQGGRVVYAGDARGPAAGAAVADGEVPARRAVDSGAVDAAPRHGADASACIGATEHNLKDVDVEIPLEHADVRHRRERIGQVDARARRPLRRASSARRATGTGASARYRSLEGAEFITDVVLVDQTPIGRTPRSNPVTYLKAFDPIRELFASTKDAAGARA